MSPRRLNADLPLLACLGIWAAAWPLAAQTASTPIAVVPLQSATPGGAATVSGALQVTGDKALIATSGAITAGTIPTQVVLPQRGTLRVCASTTVKLAADPGVPSGEIPGLMIALDHGAIETSFTTGANADTVLTPDFRILIGGPGAAHVKIRLASHGDTCIDNPAISAIDAPYVLVTSVFDGSLYRVQPGQRVMLQHGSTREVVDHEKEPCGCPPTQVQGNDFPLAQSAGMAPLPNAGPAPAATGEKPAVAAPPLVYSAEKTGPSVQSPASVGTNAPAATTPAQPAPKKPGFFRRLGHFFRRIFGAES